MVEFLGLFYKHHFRAEFFETAAMRVEVALQGEYSDRQLFFLGRREILSRFDSIRCTREITVASGMRFGNLTLMRSNLNAEDCDPTWRPWQARELDSPLATPPERLVPESWLWSR